jgi:hypothetical protein
MCDPTESCILAVCKGICSTCKLPSGGVNDPTLIGNSEICEPWALNVPVCLWSDPVRWLITVSSERWSFWIETALWLGVDSSHLCWPDCWGAWLGNWSVLSLKCTNLYINVWRPHIRIRMGRVCRVCILSCVLPSFCIWDMAVRNVMAGPTGSWLILLWTSIGCFWSLVCSISCAIRSPGRVPPSFCRLHFLRVVDIDALFCDGNWCRLKNLKTGCDVTRYMIM